MVRPRGEHPDPDHALRHGLSGRASYWSATPLKTTASGVSAAAESASTSATGAMPFPVDVHLGLDQEVAAVDQGQGVGR